MPISCIRWSPALIVVASCLTSSAADDWPMWRRDAGRSATSSEALPATLHLQWVRELGPLKPAYRTPRLQFDAGYEPVILGDALYVASSRNDSVTAYRLDTGEELWRYYVEGPVRTAPIAWNDRVFFGSDDGCMYCLSRRDGKLLWRFRAVPSGRRVLGNGRLVSLWPVRGGPVLADGVLYFAAGVWSFEGTFVYALDALTGRVVWLNDSSGFVFGQHPHAAEAFGGVTPQGYLAVSGDDLIVPCGQATPARYDLRTGILKSFELPKPGRTPGSWFLSAAQRRGEVALDAESNRDLHEDKVYQGAGEPAVRTTLRAGDRTYSFRDTFPGVEGKIHTMLAAQGKLIVVTVEGSICCLGAERPQEVRRHARSQVPVAAAVRVEVESLAQQLAGRQGYVVVVGDCGLIPSLLERPPFHIIAFDSHAERVAKLRRELDDQGRYGQRVSIHASMPADLPHYLATAVLVADLSASDAKSLLAPAFWEVLRPYGGLASLPSSQFSEETLTKALGADTSFRVERSGDRLLVLRSGALAGSQNYAGGWSSPDDRVRAPLGVLWFDDTLGHFKRSPQPYFSDGVMISYPQDWLKRHSEAAKPPYALMPPIFSDVYTGRVLASDEAWVTQSALPKRDPAEKQPQQYRPPYQTNAWNPPPPVIGERMNPLTGIKEPRAFPKSYGCDGGVDYGHLYTMRSGTPAFYDKRIESGTCSISGPRSGCTNSLIPACGLLNVPYFYEGCSCSYPLPCGLALVSMPPEHEQWAYWGPGKAEGIRRVGLNFGAPGDRMTDAGTLWLDIPNRGGASPAVQVDVQPATARYYYHHSLWIVGGEGWPWVAASGVEGASRVKLSGLAPGEYQVRLYFADPQFETAGQRVFDVSLQGDLKLKKFDVAQAAGGKMRACVRMFEVVASDGTLSIDLVASKSQPILSGVEVAARGLPLDKPSRLPERSVQTLWTSGK